MKYLFQLFTVLLVSCGGTQHILFESDNGDGRKVIVTEGVFSGIDYISVEAKIKGKTQYSMFLNCECAGKKMSLRKDSISDTGAFTFWIAVTDTLGNDKFFDEVIQTTILATPYEFKPITAEEIKVLNKGVLQSEKKCCKNEFKPVDKIIGYLKTKPV